MNILLTAFKGNNDSSKVLLDLISFKRNVDELYLDYNYQRSAFQLHEQLNRKTYDLIFSFEQQSDNDQIIIETTAIANTNKYTTTYAVDEIHEYLLKAGYKVMQSEMAGNYMANHIYAEGLMRIEKESKSTKMVLCHLPTIDRIDILKLAKDLSKYFAQLADGVK